MNDFGKTLVWAVWLGGVCVGILGTLTAGVCTGTLKFSVGDNKDNNDKSNTQPTGE